MFRTLISFCRLPSFATAMLVAASCFSAGASQAATPKMQFDVGTTVACRDVTSPSFAAANPAERLIEARFRVSILVRQGKAEDLEELLVVIASPERRLRVVDFSPRTELASDVDGRIERVETTEGTWSIDGRIGAGIKHGAKEANLGPSVGASKGEHNSVHETFHKLPAKYLVLASGTTDAEHGTFFKLKGSTQASLEGTKEFVCIFAVSEGWRGDWCVLSCQARANVKNFMSTKQEDCGQARLYVGLHLEGDGDAKLAARNLDNTQKRYLEQIARNDSQDHVAFAGGSQKASHSPVETPNLFRLMGKALKIDSDETSEAQRRQAAEPSLKFRQALNDLRRLAY
jgi:hypothetical protein